ncbi:MAG: hypothetical protein AABY18_00360, partial [Candidatus Thermoplasmatota archaeon]
SFDPTLIYTAATSGNAVYIDGVPITGNSGPMLAGSGHLTGLAAVRDNNPLAACLGGGGRRLGALRAPLRCSLHQQVADVGARRCWTLARKNARGCGQPFVNN